MINTEVVSVSSGGRVSIPERMCRDVGLTAGDKAVIVSDGANLILKPVEESSRRTYEALIRESEEFARKSGMKRSDVPAMIRKVRREGRR